MRCAAAVILAALVLAGCQASQIDTSATVTVSGRILRADGSPAGGVPVGLERELTAGDALTGVVILPLTLLTACLADPPPELCRGRNVRRATTAADGTYSFQLKGGDTQSFFGNARTLSLSAELPPGPGEVAGAAVNAGFRVQTENLVLKDLQLWQPKVTVGPGRIGWEPLAGAGDYQVGVEAGGQPVWSFGGRGREVTFDPRILEDTAGSLAVSARSSTTADGTTVSVLHRSARVAYRSTAGPPLSRGRPCTQSAGTSPATCTLTDGDFTTQLPAPATTTTAVPQTGATPPPPPASATIDLGQPRAVSLLVVRGCTCQVEGSADGRAWSTLGASAGSTAVVPARTSPARYVRLTGALTELREISVWGG
jgi:hypothetical protein